MFNRRLGKKTRLVEGGVKRIPDINIVKESLFLFSAAADKHKVKGVSSAANVSFGRGAGNEVSPVHFNYEAGKS